MLISYKSSVKQNGTERTTNAIAKYLFFFTRGAKTVISNIKLPFTVDFCTPAKTSVMMGKCPRQIVSK